MLLFCEGIVVFDAVQGRLLTLLYLDACSTLQWWFYCSVGNVILPVGTFAVILFLYVGP
jgi:hypothetical protein